MASATDRNRFLAAAAVAALLAAGSAAGDTVYSSSGNQPGQLGTTGIDAHSVQDYTPPSFDQARPGVILRADDDGDGSAWASNVALADLIGSSDVLISTTQVDLVRPSSVPEPSALLLLVFGGAIALRRRF